MKKLLLLMFVAWSVSQGRIDMLSEPEVAALHHGYTKSSLTDDLPLQDSEKSFSAKTSSDSIKQVDPEILGLSISKVKQYAKYAKMAYIQPKENGSHEEEMQQYLQPGDKVYYFATNIENSGMIIEHEDGDVTVVYKGSSSLNNWASDFWANFAYDENTGFRVHNGIMRGFYRTKDQVFNILDDLAKARQQSLEELLEKVTITGHSMGGGLTQLLQGYILANYDVETRAVSFAAPRVYDIATAEALDKRLAGKHLNISQTGDPVPLVALQSLGFRHYGTHLSLPHMWDKPHLMTNYLLALEMLEEEKEYEGFWRQYKYSQGAGESWNPYYYRAKYVDPYAHTSLKWLKDGTLYGFSNGYNFFADYWTPKQP